MPNDAKVQVCYGPQDLTALVLGDTSSSSRLLAGLADQRVCIMNMTRLDMSSAECGESPSIRIAAAYVLLEMTIHLHLATSAIVDGCNSGCGRALERDLVRL